MDECKPLRSERAHDTCSCNRVSVKQARLYRLPTQGDTGNPAAVGMMLLLRLLRVLTMGNTVHPSSTSTV